MRKPRQKRAPRTRGTREHSARREAYLAKLRDPRWQKMRLQIFERDEWACQVCYDSESTLNVHHLYYLPNTDPWDYPMSALRTLCDTCHERETESRPGAEAQLLFTLKRIGLTAEDVQEITQSFATWDVEEYWDVRVSVVTWVIERQDLLWHLQDLMFADQKQARERRKEEQA